MFEGMVDRALSRTQPEVPLIREKRDVNASDWNLSRADLRSELLRPDSVGPDFSGPDMIRTGSYTRF